MSRSYKKHPICKDGNRSKKWARTTANRRVRRYLNSSTAHRLQHRAYKKVFCSWEIADYTCLYTKEEAIARYEEHQKIAAKIPDGALTSSYSHYIVKKYPTLQSWLIEWYKMMVRK